MTTIQTFEIPGRIMARSEPHSDHGGWKNFLLNSCEVRDEADGVVFYGTSNCNYILFPCGQLIQNFGYHGKALMHRIREEGRDVVLVEFKAIMAEVDEAVACCREGRIYKEKTNG